MKHFQLKSALTGLRVLVAGSLIAVSNVAISSDDDWGSWDDLPDELFNTSELGDDDSPSLEDLLSGDQQFTAEMLEQWMLQLDQNLMLDNEEFAELLEDLEGEDLDDAMEELEDWLEDQEDDLDDELEDLAEEQERAEKEAQEAAEEAADDD